MRLESDYFAFENCFRDFRNIWKRCSPLAPLSFLSPLSPCCLLSLVSPLSLLALTTQPTHSFLTRAQTGFEVSFQPDVTRAQTGFEVSFQPDVRLKRYFKTLIMGSSAERICELCCVVKTTFCLVIPCLVLSCLCPAESCRFRCLVLSKIDTAAQLKLTRICHW
jgi:hypothetical protein